MRLWQHWSKVRAPRCPSALQALLRTNLIIELQLISIVASIWLGDLGGRHLGSHKGCVRIGDMDPPILEWDPNELIAFDSVKQLSDSSTGARRNGSALGFEEATVDVA